MPWINTLHRLEDHAAKIPSAKLQAGPEGINEQSLGVIIRKEELTDDLPKVDGGSPVLGVQDVRLVIWKLVYKAGRSYEEESKLFLGKTLPATVVNLPTDHMTRSRYDALAGERAVTRVMMAAQFHNIFPNYQRSKRYSSKEHLKFDSVMVTP